MNPEVIAAFLAGAASIIGGVWTVRRARQEEQRRCDQRLSELRQTYDEGIEKGLTLERPEGR